MLISDMRSALENYLGSSPCPPDFEDFWQEQNRKAAARREVRMVRIDYKNPIANYYELEFDAADGTPLKARYICPISKAAAPCVLMFHDYGRGIRGWHHMTRFAALGFAVLALESRGGADDVARGYRSAPEGLAFVQHFMDALTLAHVALSLPRTAPDKLITWGEGLGGGLAIAVAAMLPHAVAKCAALNPLPSDFKKAVESDCSAGLYSKIQTHFRQLDPLHKEEEALFIALAYVDCANFASLLSGELQLNIGSGLMDNLAPPATQYAIYNRAGCRKSHLIYPKYEHERINFYENELLKFFRF